MDKPSPPIFSLLDEKLLRHIHKALQDYIAGNTSISREDYQLICDYIKSYQWFANNSDQQ